MEIECAAETSPILKFPPDLGPSQLWLNKSHVGVLALAIQNRDWPHLCSPPHHSSIVENGYDFLLLLTLELFDDALLVLRSANMTGSLPMSNHVLSHRLNELRQK
ncbi:hypothetical protein ES703_40503 [subsurface metagenome]